MSIPLVDLKAQHLQVADEVSAGWSRVLENTSFVLGKDVAEFEQAFARFSGVKRCVGVANGTDAIEMVVRAAGLGPQDEIIVPANTFIATALGVARAGARPVLVDSDPEYHLLDPEDLSRKLTPRTRAVFAVHLYGQAAPLDAILDRIAGKNVFLFEDAAQAHGATQQGVPVGKRGYAAAFSFYPGKNLGAYGDGGAVVTEHDAVAEKIVALRNYGSAVKYHHPELGFNSRLDTLQAVVLSAKLKRLAEWNEARRQAAKRYDALLADVPELQRPKTLAGNEHVWHLYVIRVPNRDKVLAKLNAAGIGAGIHYPIPLHLQGALANLGYQAGDFPVAEKAATEILSLPMFAEITPEQQNAVVEALKGALVG